MPAALTVPNPLPQLPAAVETAAYRITTEAVHNVVKHAKAHSCAVRIEHDGRQLELTVQDDGQGLPPTPTLGLGMASMRERAEELGGTLVVAAGPRGAGLTVRAVLPYADPAARAGPPERRSR